MIVKINYEIDGYAKYIIGELKEETNEFFIIISRDNLEYRIGKQFVKEMREYRDRN